MQEKAELRARYLEQRRALTPEEVAVRSRAACENLRTLPEFDRAPALLIYLASIDNELDTRPFVDALLTEGRTVLVPVTLKGRRLEWSRLEALSEVEPGRFGVLEPPPRFRRPVAPPPEALAVVPGLVFARDGFRIGYGGGYYDRFLAGFPGTKAGVAYDFQIADLVPVEDHDIPMDVVVTDRAVYVPARNEGG